jgi:hypothetical protein
MDIMERKGVHGGLAAISQGNCQFWVFSERIPSRITCRAVGFRLAFTKRVGRKLIGSEGSIREEGQEEE